jgi:hypothetical protein
VRRQRADSLGEEGLPAPERHRRLRPTLAMELDRFRDQAHGACRLRLDPRQLLGGAQRGQLGFEPAFRDVAAGHLGDADDVVEDQRAQRAAAVRALEQDPRGARAAAVDAREPGAHGARGAALHDRHRPRRGGRRDAPLRETIERPLGGPPHGAIGRALGKAAQGRQRFGAVLVGERAETAVEDVLGEPSERGRVQAGGRLGHPNRSRKNGC